MRKKLFAILMSAMMMVTFMPTMAFATAVPSTLTDKVAKIQEEFAIDHTDETTKSETVVAPTCTSVVEYEKHTYRNGDYVVERTANSENRHSWTIKEMSFDEAEALVEDQVYSWIEDYVDGFLTGEPVDKWIYELLLGFGPADNERLDELKDVIREFTETWNNYTVNPSGNAPSNAEKFLVSSLATLRSEVGKYFTWLRNEGHGYAEKQILENMMEASDTYCYFRVKLCEKCNEVDSAIGFKHVAPENLAPCALSYECTKCNKTVYQYNHNITDTKTVVDNLLNNTGLARLSTFFNQLYFSDVKANMHKLTTTSEKTACGEVKTVSCSECGLSYSYTIPTTVMKHEFEWKTLVAPDCSKSAPLSAEGHKDRLGLRVKKCKVCGAIDLLSFSAEEPKHNYVEKTIEPTCTLPGYTVTMCDNCSATMALTSKNFVSAKGHDYNVEMVVEPGCGSNGLLKIECKTCGKARYYTDLDEVATTVSNLDKFINTAWKYPMNDIVKVEDELHGTAKYYFLGFFYDLLKAPIELTNPAAAGHKFTTWGISAEPTCTTGTVWAPMCSKCGVVATAKQVDNWNNANPNAKQDTFKDVDALGHDWKEFTLEETCEHKAGILKSCQRCDAEEYYDADGFKVENTANSPFWKGGKCVSDNEWVTITPSTFTKVGMRVTHCMKCGGIVVREDIGVKKLAKAYQPTLKAGKKSFKATFKNVGKAASGVQVAYKVKGANNYKYKTTDKSSLTVKGLKSGKKYTVKVRKFVKEDGKTIYGKWCAVKYVTVK